uniref:Isopentenyl diphosphate isomerase n=1 Tax=Rhizophora mucronata TaxID=61149 RepID=A0A2P2JGL6_RHIMU
MLSPLSIRGCLVKHAPQWDKLINRHINSRNTKLVQKLPLCSIPHPKSIIINELRFTI